jgi:glucokinase
MPGRRTIGVDVGGTKLLAGAVDSELSVHHRTQRTFTQPDQAAVLETVVDAVEEIRDQVGHDVLAIGFGIPCLIDRRTGRSVMSVHLPLADLRFADVMTERLGLPVFVDNDANTAVLAELRAGAARGFRDVVMLTIGTGIGGGLVLDGRVYRGAIGAGAELGHTVIDMDGPPCQGNCPNRGCVEVMASGTALAREATRIAAERPGSALATVLADGYRLEGPLVTELAYDGDPAAIQVIELIGTRLGVAISSFVNIFNPQLVIIGGGVMAAGDLLLEPARLVVAQRSLSPSRDEVKIVPAAIGVESGMIGAAAMAFDGLAEGAAASGGANVP